MESLTVFDAPSKADDDQVPSLVRRQSSSPSQPPIKPPLLGTYASAGCYKSAGNMTTHAVKNMSSGSCNDLCKKEKFPVSGLQGNECYCGFVYPPASDLAKDENCDFPCPYYGQEACGGISKPGSNSDATYWSVYNVGLVLNVKSYKSPSSSSSSSPDPTSSPSESDSPTPAVVTQTRTAEPSPGTEEAKSGPNNGPVIAGSVVGVIVLILLLLGVYLFIRRRRNSEIEEEHRRNAAVNAFINGSKPPGSSGSMSMTDSRLDPVLAHRRMSDGSIADNEDYSRRILRVTNA